MSATEKEIFGVLWPYLMKEEVTDIDYNGSGLWVTYENGLRKRETREKQETAGSPEPFFKNLIPGFHKLVCSAVAQMVKNLPAMQEPWVRSLGWEDPLEKGLATHISILACRIPWTEEPGGLHSIGLQRVGHDLSNLAAAAACCSVLCYAVLCCAKSLQSSPTL